ncbi:phosphatidic acid phosphatase type 2/haloperoxidase [Podospora fimiseda]|uniref:Phosphatidic acid phosphatase type 2/haloperoxidase n=1 Tax=Podospora fimiseda TaxID=252190 RepID=A0AAN7BS98_9PEZI|nr:phosphatidic acid phosphatase type 2/haloperoxidase [Podospora fimiseda]
MAPSRASNMTGSGTGLVASFGRFWKRTYASDYVGFTFLLISYLLIQFFVEPFHRMFSLTDLRISFPHAEIERVPLTVPTTVHDFVYALFFPIFIIVLYNLSNRSPSHKHHVSILGIAISLVLTSLLTDIIKNMVGRPRPDLLARCIPSPSASASATRGLVSIDICTQTDHHTLHDGWRSFPSGHSSFSFAGLGYLSLFLAGQTKIFAYSSTSTLGEQTEKLVRGDLMKALFCLAPLLGATMIAISRCQDYRHDVYDVCIGALLGWIVTYWSYRRYWPRLGSGRCDEPYAGPLNSGDDTAGRYGRLRDEEDGGGCGAGPRNVGIELGILNTPR